MIREELELRERIEKLLEVYTIQELFDFNDTEESDILLYLYNEGMIVFPDTEPLE